MTAETILDLQAELTKAGIPWAGDSGVIVINGPSWQLVIFQTARGLGYGMAADGKIIDEANGLVKLRPWVNLDEAVLAIRIRQQQEKE